MEDPPFRALFERDLLAPPTRDYQAGLELAAMLGRPSVPLLWDLLRDEKSNVARRNALLAAAMLAGGAGTDERLYEWLGQQKAIKEERAMAAMIVALSPNRARAIPDFWRRSLGPTKSPEQVLEIAVRLAIARVPGARDGVPQLTEDEVGLAAATAFSGLPILPSIAARHWDLDSPDRHEELFWRGALLQAARAVESGEAVAPAVLVHANEIAARRESGFASAREAAALVRLAAHVVQGSGEPPPFAELRLCASERRAAVALRAWLSPRSEPRDEKPQRLAISYVLSREVAEVVADRAIWGEDVRIRAHVAIALAWRMLDEPQVAPVEAQLNGVPEWFFVQWASGAAEPFDGRCQDPILQCLAQLAQEGRLSRAAARTALEETLWRWGSHPGLGRYECERLLLRDLLLVGSNAGSRYVAGVDFHQRYRPTGIGHESAFFDIAVAVYDFFTTPRSPLPPQYRLR